MSYQEIIANFSDVEGGIIEAFHAVQESLNYLPEEAILEAAQVFKIPASQAYGVASFYSMFSVVPRGKNVIRICQSAPCHVAGAAEVIEALEKELGVIMGQTTADGKFNLEFTECVGQCQDTPVITINGQAVFGVKPAQIPQIIANYR